MSEVKEDFLVGKKGLKETTHTHTHTHTLSLSLSLSLSPSLPPTLSHLVVEAAREDVGEERVGAKGVCRDHLVLVEVAARDIDVGGG